MRNLKSIFRESVTLAMYMGLVFAGWQTALAAGSMPHQLSTPITWIHFMLYSLGGFVLFGFVLLIPGIIVGLLVGLFKKNWETISIRKFLLAGAIGTGIILVVVALRQGLVLPVIMSAGSGGMPVVIAVGLILLSYLIGTALAVGALAMFESRPARSQWCMLWGWWLFMAFVPPFALSARGLPSFIEGVIIFVVAVVTIFVLIRFLPGLYEWLQRGRVARWSTATGILFLIYLVTVPFPNPSPAGQLADSGSPPVILISIDTLRPDAIDCYPSGDTLRLGTPNIQRIADDGAVFDRAYSTAPWTVPSVGSFISGLPPGAHGAVDDASSVLAPGATTIAEILGSNGYATGGFVVNAMLGPGSGMEQGFDVFDEEMHIHRDGRRLLFQRLIDRIRLYWPDPVTPNDNPVMERDAVCRASRFIRSHAGERFFLWLHLFAPHSSWIPPMEYRKRAADELGIEVSRRDIMRQPLLKDGTTPVTPDVLDGVYALYAGEVAFTDDNVGKIIEELEAQGIMDECLFVITSDHGEEFFEHDRIEHGYSLYPELLHVPLIMKLPGKIDGSTRIPEMVSLVDLAPTILDLVSVQPELDGRPAEFTGRSLVPLLRDETLDAMPVFVEDPLLFDRGIQGVFLDDFYYIGGSGAVMHPRLYDLRTDPGAWYDILRDYPDEAERMSIFLDEYTDMCESIAERVGAFKNGGNIEGLRSLGYLN